MSVENLHDAALVLKGAHQAIERLLDETEPMERAFYDALPAFPCSDEDYERVAEETGYKPYTDAVCNLTELLRSVERTEIKAFDARRGAA